MNIGFLPAAEPVVRLIEELHKLPGIGPKNAQRLTYYLLRAPEDQAKALAEAIVALKEKTVLCSICYNFADSDPCLICRDEERDQTKVCVVQEPLDILALERTRKYQGLYHVLHGVLSPVEGIGPEELRMKELLPRLQIGRVEEVILATSNNLEGESTAMYLQHLIAPLGIQITRLARGLPFGGDLQYADEVTLTRAIEGRQKV